MTDFKTNKNILKPEAGNYRPVTQQTNTKAGRYNKQSDVEWSHGLTRALGPTQLLEEQRHALARDGQRVVQRCLDELPVSCSQAEQLLRRTSKE